MSYIPTIGLEIHVNLKTRTKMFCSCPNNFEENNPNTNVCPICLGHPGTLPTINKNAVEAVIKLGLALRGNIANQSNFDRKSYFYPDLPKGYQISQYDHPIVENGTLNGVKVRRIHLEEDAGRLVHDNPSTNSEQQFSLVDFNRAGTPLMELVTDPDIKSSEEAVNFAKELQLILRYLGISDADMEKGQMRVEANISLLNKDGSMGTKVEVKNISSFKAVHDAIQYELKRQEETLEEGGEIIQETRGWNESKKKTESQRSKESAHDYRYFPEPDLPSFDVNSESSGWDIEDMRRHLPELPEAKRNRLTKEYNLNQNQVGILIEEREMADYFEETASELRIRNKGSLTYNTLHNYLVSDLKGLMKERGVSFSNLKINPEEFAHLVNLVALGEISSRIAKDLLVKMFESGEGPETLMKSGGMSLLNDESELTKIVKEIIEKNPKTAEDYRKGKSQALQFFLGQVMAKTKGQADPQITQKVLIQELK